MFAVWLRPANPLLSLPRRAMRPLHTAPMTTGTVVFFTLVATALYVLSIWGAFQLGREQGRDDVLDHGWKHKEPRP